MNNIPPEVAHRIAALAVNRESGASELLEEVIAILREARNIGAAVRPVARAICRAQPTMAPVWNAALEAVASERSQERFDRFTQRVVRSSEALRRFAVECFSPLDSRAGRPGQDPGEAGSGASPLRFVTISLSRSVEIVFEAVRERRPIRVSCSESRPALEGRRFASRLAATGVPVTCFADAAISHALAAADAVILGADAIGPEWFLNKSGSRMLAAAAAQQGVPVYVAATRDKFVGHAVGARLIIREGAPAEVWEEPPAGIEVRNPYFESTPLDVVTGIISDLGVLGIGMVPEVCNSTHDPAILRALDEIGT